MASLAHTLSPHANRQRQPELEADYNRSTSLGYEPPAEVGFIRCLDHGYPTPLARWHCHDEYELHLITATSGKAFVGDWIGPFEPGHVVLCGPRLPHNWISVDIPPEGVAKRDLVIQFRHEPVEQACLTIPELIRRDFLNKKLPLPSGTKVDLTLDTSLNLDQLLADFAEYQALRGSQAVQP